MDHKLKTLEAELETISKATEIMSHFLKVVNIMASKKVDTWKCISKSNANEKLAAYLKATQILTDIKSRIVTDSGALESFLISIGYVEDEDEAEKADNSMDDNKSTISQPSVTANIESNIADFIPKEERLQQDCNTNFPGSVRFDQIPNTTNIESVNINQLEFSTGDVTSESTATNLITTQTSDSSRPPGEILKTLGDASQSSATKRNQVNVEEYFKENKVMSLEDRHLTSLLEKSRAPDLRLHRSASPTSSTGTKSSNNSDVRNKPKSNDVNSSCADWMKTCLEKERVNSPISLKDNNAGVTTVVQFTAGINSDSSEDTRNRNFTVHSIPRVNENCIISCFKNPQHLYIQLFHQTDVLLALSENLNATYENSPVQFTIKSNAKEEIGNNCVAYVEEYHSWHRVQVLDWQLMSHTNTVLVFLIDYGDVLKVPVEMLRKLMSEFFEYPMFAVHCSLDSLYPPASVDNNINTIWTTAELNAFYEFMKDGNQVLYKLTYVNSESDPIGIDLINSEDTNLENSLGQDLINANIVKQILFDEVKLIPDSTLMLEQIKSVQGLQGISKDMPESERLEKYLDNNVYNEPENIVEAATGYDANDERRVCKFTRKDGTCFKGLNCKLEHTQLRPDGFTTDKNFVYHQALHTYILPHIDDDIRIYLTCITRPNEFYGHILGRDEMRIYGTMLQQLATDLKNPLAIRRFERLQLQPTVGQIVLAKNWDGTWCRAKVIEIDGLTADVFIVDYGETVTVSIKDDLREISRDYLILPFQAVKFFLWDIEKVPEVSEEEVITYLETHYLCNEFSATVRTCNPHLYVDVQVGADIDMCADLIKQGFVRRTYGKQLIFESILVD